jgi:translocation and assembly module TamB
MRRLLKWLFTGVAVLLALPVLAIAILLLLANIGPGRTLIEDQTKSLTGGVVVIHGLAGRFPDALRIGQIQVSDAKGVYVTATDVALDWSPLKLLSRTALIDQLQASKLEVSRLPDSGGGTSSSSGGPFTLPVRVDLRRLEIPQAIIGAPVAGAAAILSLEGSGELQSLTEGTVRIDARRVDTPGTYAIYGTITPDDIQASIRAVEPAKGLIATIANVPDIGALSLQASVNGQRNALATQVGMTAGQLTASSSGTIDIDHQTADLAITAQAPAMTPGPGISWQSILVDLTVRGPLLAPDATGTVRIRSLAAGGARIGTLAADVKGNARQVNLHAILDDLHVPGPSPDLLASAPLVLDGSARLDAAGGPVTFALRHKLLSVDGTARTKGTQDVQAHVVLADIAPFAAIGGVDLKGRADLTAKAAVDGDTTDGSVTGTVGITGGMAPAPALIGDNGRIDVAGSMHGQDFSLSHLTLNGKALDVTASGGLADQKLDLTWTVNVSDITAVQPDLSGSVQANGHAGGALDDLSAQIDLAAEVASKNYKPGHVTAHVDASGLPKTPHAAVTANGTLLDSPLDLALTADQADGAAKVDITQATWKSFKALGAVSLTPPAVLPAGKLHIDFGRLADVQPLLGRPIAGSAAADLDSDDQAAHLTVTAKDLSLPGTAAVGKAMLTATVTDPTAHPVLDASLTADGVSAGSSVKGASAKVTAKGPLDAVALTVAANAPDLAGGPARLTTAGTVNATGRTLALARMEAGWKQDVLKLLAPANFDFTSGVSMDRVRLGLRQAVLTVSGSAGDTLDLTATLRDLPADLATVVAPSLAADGVIAADARLTGTGSKPEGTIKLTADRVHLRQGPGAALPPANLAANATLLGTSARLDARLTEGPSHLTVTGTAPLSAGGALDLKSEGRIDLAMLDPILAAQGRRARGEVILNAGMTGTAAAPRINGTMELVKGDVADYGLGAHVSELAAIVRANGDTVRLETFTGKAGPGTLGGNGTINLAGQMPVDLHFTASNARPLSSDLLTALIDANLIVQGEVKGDMTAAGKLHVRRADIHIPDKLPAGIAVLPVRDAGAPPPPPPSPEEASKIALDLTLDAPQQVFIRGRGLNAELGGSIHIGGTTTTPLPDGGLHLRQGTLSIIGTTLNFTEGTVDFSGGGLADPTIHFVATSTNSTMVATLTVSGDAKDPKIKLSSVPDMPQDEILAQILFNTSTSKLSPLQLAQIAAALASLSGATAGFDPLDKIRGSLGLDRLSVGSDAAGNPSLEAGRYVARGVYVGAKQSASGSGTQATVQIDLAKGLKLETTAGSSGASSATGAASSGDAASVGLKYQFEY